MTREAPRVKQCPRCCGHGWRVIDYRDWKSLVSQAPRLILRITLWAAVCGHCDGKTVVPVGRLAIKRTRLN